MAEALWRNMRSTHLVAASRVTQYARAGFYATRMGNAYPGALATQWHKAKACFVAVHG